MIGATGLVGSHLLKRLLGDDRVSKVVSLGRRKTGTEHPKLEEHVVDFEAPAAWANLVRGDVAFSTLGTTAAQAKSQAAQRRVDYDYQLGFARQAAENGVPTFVLCSTASANVKALVFYARLRGELDRDVQALPFPRLRIVRPNLLAGDRGKLRLGEDIGRALLGAANALGIGRRHRATHGDVVAAAMINAAFDSAPGVQIVSHDDVFTLAYTQPPV